MKMQDLVNRGFNYYSSNNEFKSGDRIKDFKLVLRITEPYHDFLIYQNDKGDLRVSKFHVGD